MDTVNKETSDRDLSCGLLGCDATQWHGYPTSLHGITMQKTMTSIFTAMKTSNLTSSERYVIIVTQRKLIVTDTDNWSFIEKILNSNVNQYT